MSRCANASTLELEVGGRLRSSAAISSGGRCALGWVACEARGDAASRCARRLRVNAACDGNGQGYCGASVSAACKHPAHSTIRRVHTRAAWRAMRLHVRVRALRLQLRARIRDRRECRQHELEQDGNDPSQVFASRAMEHACIIPTRSNNSKTNGSFAPWPDEVLVGVPDVPTYVWSNGSSPKDSRRDARVRTAAIGIARRRVVRGCCARQGGNPEPD